MTHTLTLTDLSLGQKSWTVNTAGLRGSEGSRGKQSSDPRRTVSGHQQEDRERAAGEDGVDRPELVSLAVRAYLPRSDEPRQAGAAGAVRRLRNMLHSSQADGGPALWPVDPQQTHTDLTNSHRLGTQETNRGTTSSSESSLLHAKDQLSARESYQQFEKPKMGIEPFEHDRKVSGFLPEAPSCRPRQLGAEGPTGGREELWLLCAARFMLFLLNAFVFVSDCRVVVQETGSETTESDHITPKLFLPLCTFQPGISNSQHTKTKVDAVVTQESKVHLRQDKTRPRAPPTPLSP
ncbi:hypothetical protein AOLI_G00253610 [Acnodon oligacanthus]